MTMIQWRILRVYLAAGGLSAGCYRTLDWAAEVMMIMEIGTGIGIGAGEDDDLV